MKSVLDLKTMSFYGKKQNLNAYKNQNAIIEQQIMLKQQQQDIQDQKNKYKYKQTEKNLFLDKNQEHEKTKIMQENQGNQNYIKAHLPLVKETEKTLIDQDPIIKGIKDLKTNEQTQKNIEEISKILEANLEAKHYENDIIQSVDTKYSVQSGYHVLNFAKIDIPDTIAKRIEEIRQEKSLQQDGNMGFHLKYGILEDIQHLYFLVEDKILFIQLPYIGSLNKQEKTSFYNNQAQHLIKQDFYEIDFSKVGGRVYSVAIGVPKCNYLKRKIQEYAFVVSHVNCVKIYELKSHKNQNKITLHDLDIQIETDNEIIEVIEFSQHGRIFIGGTQGKVKCIDNYTLNYAGFQWKEKIEARTQKQNIIEKIFDKSKFLFSDDDKKIISQISIDDSRNVLYALRKTNYKRYRMRKQLGNEYKCTTDVEVFDLGPISEEFKHFLTITQEDLDFNLRKYFNITNHFTLKRKNTKIQTIKALSSKDSSLAHFMLVLRCGEYPMHLGETIEVPINIDNRDHFTKRSLQFQDWFIQVDKPISFSTDYNDDTSLIQNNNQQENQKQNQNISFLTTDQQANQINKNENNNQSLINYQKINNISSSYNISFYEKNNQVTDIKTAVSHLVFSQKIAESKQQYFSPQHLIILTEQDIQYVIKLRPVDLLYTLLYFQRFFIPTVFAKEFTSFISTMGVAETLRMLIQIQNAQHEEFFLLPKLLKDYLKSQFYMLRNLKQNLVTHLEQIQRNELFYVVENRESDDYVHSLATQTYNQFSENIDKLKYKYNFLKIQGMNQQIENKIFPDEQSLKIDSIMLHISYLLQPIWNRSLGNFGGTFEDLIDLPIDNIDLGELQIIRDKIIKLYNQQIKFKQDQYQLKEQKKRDNPLYLEVQNEVRKAQKLESREIEEVDKRNVYNMQNTIGENGIQYLKKPKDLVQHESQIAKRRIIQNNSINNLDFFPINEQMAMEQEEKLDQIAEYIQVINQTLIILSIIIEAPLKRLINLLTPKEQLEICQINLKSIMQSKQNRSFLTMIVKHIISLKGEGEQNEYFVRHLIEKDTPVYFSRTDEVLWSLENVLSKLGRQIQQEDKTFLEQKLTIFKEPQLNVLSQQCIPILANNVQNFGEIYFSYIERLFSNIGAIEYLSPEILEILIILLLRFNRDDLIIRLKGKVPEILEVQLRAQTYQEQTRILILLFNHHFIQSDFYNSYKYAIKIANQQEFQFENEDQSIFDIRIKYLELAKQCLLQIIESIETKQFKEDPNGNYQEKNLKFYKSELFEIENCLQQVNLQKILHYKLAIIYEDLQEQYKELEGQKKKNSDIYSIQIEDLVQRMIILEEKIISVKQNILDIATLQNIITFDFDPDLRTNLYAYQLTIINIDFLGRKMKGLINEDQLRDLYQKIGQQFSNYFISQQDMNKLKKYDKFKDIYTQYCNEFLSILQDIYKNIQLKGELFPINYIIELIPFIFSQFLEDNEQYNYKMNGDFLKFVLILDYKNDFDSLNNIIHFMENHPLYQFYHKYVEIYNLNIKGGSLNPENLILMNNLKIYHESLTILMEELNQHEYLIQIQEMVQYIYQNWQEIQRWMNINMSKDIQIMARNNFLAQNKSVIASNNSSFNQNYFDYKLKTCLRSQDAEHLKERKKLNVQFQEKIEQVFEVENWKVFTAKMYFEGGNSFYQYMNDTLDDSIEKENKRQKKMRIKQEKREFRKQNYHKKLNNIQHNIFNNLEQGEGQNQQMNGKGPKKLRNGKFKYNKNKIKNKQDQQDSDNENCNQENFINNDSNESQDSQEQEENDSEENQEQKIFILNKFQGQCIQTIKENEKQVNCILNLQDQYLVSGGEDKFLRFFEIFTGSENNIKFEKIHELKFEHEIKSIYYFDNDLYRYAKNLQKKLFIGFQNGDLIQYEILVQEEEQSKNDKLGLNIKDINLINYKQQFVNLHSTDILGIDMIENMNKQQQIVETNQNKKGKKKSQKKNKQILQVSYQTLQYIVTYSKCGEIKSTKCNNQQDQVIYDKPEGKMQQNCLLIVKPDKFITVSTENCIRLYQADQEKVQFNHEIQNEENGLTCIQRINNMDEKFVRQFAVAVQSKIIIFEINNAYTEFSQFMSIQNPHNLQINKMLLIDSPQNYLVTGSDDNKVKLWNIDLNQFQAESSAQLQGHDQPIQDIQQIQNIIITCSSDQYIKFWI
ncbi:WD40-repeat-containing domain [Pseudocohnilembus persalinus]|uniref:WD40-repeat-containing domain n=1 Tax=Pseudocohnilembus persalinus TaxID=266149 RepID=A0A0V0QPL5_PSEPJ|nr:WD40-repeat-containing domain [Pseudocohnilembus persalinus]|eukprot:KRX04178.1 WD40-repeat-containing domain [Pseudocohnilembus persalinus]